MILIDDYMFNKDEILMIFKDKNMSLEDGIRVIFKDKTNTDMFFIGYELDKVIYIGSDKE